MRFPQAVQQLSIMSKLALKQLPVCHCIPVQLLAPRMHGMACCTMAL